MHGLCLHEIEFIEIHGKINKGLLKEVKERIIKELMDKGYIVEM